MRLHAPFVSIRLAGSQILSLSPVSHSLPSRAPHATCAASFSCALPSVALRRPPSPSAARIPSEHQLWGFGAGASMFQRRKSFQSAPSASSSTPTGSTNSGASTVPGPPKKLIQVLTTRKTVLVPATLTKAVNCSPSSSKVGVKTGGPSLKHGVSNGASAVATTTTSSSSSSSSKAKNNNSLAGPSSSSDKSARTFTSASSPKKLNGGSAQLASPIKRKAEAVVSAEANKHIKSASTSPARSQAAHKTKKRASSSALTRSSSDVDSSSSAASPNKEEDDSDSSDSDTPRNRRQSTPVVERDVYDGSETVTEAEKKGALNRIDASKLVMLSRSAYRDYFIDPIDPEKSNVQWSGNDIPTIDLEYPGNGSEKFYLLAPKNDNEYDPIEDVMTVIRTVLDVFLTPPQSLALFGYTPGLNSFSAFLSAPPSRSATPGTPTDTGTPSSATFPTSTLPPLMRQLEKAKAKRDGPAFIAAIERYNAGIKELKANSIMKQNIQGLKGLKEKTWTKIAAQSYDRAVGPGLDELSKYEAFSDNVYGELLPTFMSEIFQKTKLGPGSVFVDLGSGVGNCVVQAALATGCEAWGFENMAHASSLARAQVVEAETRHKLWGVSAGKMEVIEADFCEHPLVGQVLKRADVILVNNEVFSSVLNQRLSLLFLDLASGTRIVSLKAFAHSFNLSAHNRHSPLAILDQGQPLTYGRKSVSWKEEGGKYFIGRIDREKVARFDEKERRREKREKTERVERGSEENVG